MLGISDKSLYLVLKDHAALQRDADGAPATWRPPERAAPRTQSPAARR